MSKYMLQNQQECPCNQCSTDPYFKIENCFNELVTEVQKANARYNLGIADEWNLKWGNIKEFIEEQKDLTEYLDKYIQVYKQALNEINNTVKSKVDRSEIPDIQNPYNQAYTHNDNPEVHSIGEALDALLYKELEITLAKTNPEIGEIGETVDVVFGWGYNKFIESQTCDSTEMSAATRSTTVRGITETTSKLLVASDGVKTKSKLITIPFKQACYYGTANTTPTSEIIIDTFTRDLKFDKGSTVTITANTGDYIYFILPKSLEDITFYVGGFEGGFSIINNDFKFSRYGNVYDCVLIRSDNSGLGTTTINTK